MQSATSIAAYCSSSRTSWANYNMLASDFVLSEARKDGLYFTPCTWTSLVHNRPHRSQRIRRMVEAGLNITINTDDPAMFGTSLGHGFTTLFDTINWAPDMARRFSLNSVERSWLEESDKSALRMAGVTAAAYAVTMHWFAFLMGRKFAL